LPCAAIASSAYRSSFHAIGISVLLSCKMTYSGSDHFNEGGSNKDQPVAIARIGAELILCS
jgi:hypothetical protein